MSDKPNQVHWVSGFLWSLMLQAVKSLFKKKKGFYTYLQYTQLLAKESDLQPFSKSLFCGCCWFFPNKNEELYKNEMQERRVKSEDLLLESYCQ